MMTKHARTGCLAMAIGLVLSIGAAAAQGGSQGRGRGASSEAKSSTTSVSVVFRESDRTTFREYFVTHKIVAQPVPPGIAKNVAEHGVWGVTPYSFSPSSSSLLWPALLAGVFKIVFSHDRSLS